MELNQLPLVGALLERLRNRSLQHDVAKAAMASRGDVTKMEGYQQMADVISRLNAIDNGSGSLGRPLRTVNRTHKVLLDKRATFQKAFGPGGSESMRFAYVSAVLALWHVVSLLCSTGVVFVKNTSVTYSPLVNKDGVTNIDRLSLVDRLEEFNKLADKHGFDQVVTEHAPVIDAEAGHGLLREAFPLLYGVAIAVGIVAALLYLARDITEFVFYVRGSTARWLEVQANFLQMNAATLGQDKASSRQKQEAYAARMRSLADRIRIDAIDADREVVKNAKTDDAEIQSQVAAAHPQAAAQGAGGLL